MLIELEKLVPHPLPDRIVESSAVWRNALKIEPQSKVLFSASVRHGKVHASPYPLWFA